MFGMTGEQTLLAIIVVMLTSAVIVYLCRQGRV